MLARPEFIALIILFVWSAILTALFLRFYFFYSSFSKNADKKNLMEVLNGLVHANHALHKDLEKLVKRCDTLEKDGRLHIQKVGMLRFNPFKDTGGDQSFILALLDDQDTGVVISSLHTRTGTRWYAKAVVNGKGAEYELSGEELKALKEAQHRVQ